MKVRVTKRARAQLRQTKDYIQTHIHDDVIEIVAFWDTRREPKEQAGQVE